MADDEKIVDHGKQDTERKIERPSTSRAGREQRTMTRSKEKFDENHLPTPPPDPWRSPSWYLRAARSQAEMTQARNLDEDEDIIAYLTDLSIPAFEGQTSECPSRNSTTSTMPVANLCLEEAFEHLNRLYALSEQILELRYRTSKFFKRVRNLEKLKVLRNADRILEDAFARDAVPASDFCEEDTGFAESLLDAMLSNCRDPQFQRRNARSPLSRQTRGKSDVEKQTSVDDVSKGAPKVSKWTRVKAAFKWERACTNDLAETMDAVTTIATPGVQSSQTPKYLRIPDTDTGNLTSTSASSCTDVISESVALSDRTSSASLSNERSYDCSPKSVPNHFEYPSSKAKENKEEQCISRRSQSLDGDMIALNIERANDTSRINETGQETPLIRITSEKNHTRHSLNGMDEPDQVSKRPTPSLTITIPPHEEEIRGMSSPESYSPLPSSAHTSGGNSPQQRKIHRELLTSKGFKRQQSNDDESASLTSKTQRQDSKWNKVRRAFLTSSSLSVPPSPIRVFSRQMFLPDGQEVPAAYSCSGSVDDLQQTAALNAQSDTRRDYRALREKLGAEFHRKLVEWERLKNLSPRVSMKDAREISSSSLNPRESLLSEERLAPEFRKKLQDWKRAKKERRGSAPFEQQRFNRRRLTDWQLWRSPSKTDYRNRENSGPRGSYGSGESIVSGGRSHLTEDFVRKMEAWKRANETGNRDTEQTTRSYSNRLGIASGIDESEFLALERLLSRFDSNVNKERRESNARQLDECFDGDTRSYIDGAQNANEVLVRTSVGSYRFEGISREFTQKLYDWERYRGISPRSSTFRLLGPAYDPFLRETSIVTPMSTTTEIGRDERESFKVSTLKRSKSVGSLIPGTILSETFVHRSTSLQSLGYLANTLKNSDRFNTSPVSIDRGRADEATEDAVMDDSEPEAMIVDIEDVIEETASPLERVQPHQTPVYSVAASETTSIAVPLGTVTSSHEPSPVFLVEVEEPSTRKQRKSKKWNRRNSCSSEDNLSTENCEITKIGNKWRNRFNQDDADSECWSIAGSLDRQKYSINDSFDYPDFDKDSIKSDSSMYSLELNKKSKIVTELNKTANEREEIPAITSDGENINETTMEEWNVDAQSKLATCRYNQDLPSEKKNEEEYRDQKAEGDGSSDTRKCTIETETKTENEYEIINAIVDPSYCTMAESNPASFETNITNTALESSTSYKLSKSNHTVFDVDPCRATEKEDFESDDKDDSVLKNESHDRSTYYNLPKMESKLPDAKSSECSDNEQRDSCIAEAATTNESVATNERQQYRAFENVPTSMKLQTKNSCTGEHHQESTIQTTSLTVSSCREERCVERIIVNEETLNKMVVPTASNSCTETMKDQKMQPSIDAFAAKGSTRENDYRSSVPREAPTDHETVVKKRCSPTRNVFIKTKRMIFSPFRRAEDSSSKLEGSSERDQVHTLRSKSKSRSTSPKVNRQEVLLRMSFSLPWPLRPSSKDRDSKEAKIDKALDEDRAIEKEDRRKSVENKRKSSSSESNVFRQSRMEDEVRTSKDRNSCMARVEEKSRFKYPFGPKEHRASVSVEVNAEEQQNGVSATVSSSSLRHEDRNSDPLRFDPHSPDLMHKLQILSSVVARRDGRTDTISEESAMESHSLRIRRAKEDFLSRRGGPLCHSAMEPPSSIDHGFRQMSVNHYERIYDEQSTTRDKRISDAETYGSKSVETTNRTVTKLEGVDDLNEENVNELSRNLTVSLPARVKSASAGMINVDPDIFERFAESNRGCESLPRTISNQQEPKGPLTKIVNKFKFVRLICGKEQGNMSTVSRLCRQSLLIDVRNDFERLWEAKGRAEIPNLNNMDRTSKEE
ncbi:uncharacterized protein LOC143143535 isoform X2 [Ptiloglossa arizonensis]|uniref:uncharacterized protein LOC143143535 isoform X2 n=1 Tax=Ptiloglossa arizonensis TaxID=3350558 RepID=UPI003F9FA527